LLGFESGHQHGKLLLEGRKFILGRAVRLLCLFGWHRRRCRKARLAGFGLG